VNALEKRVYDLVKRHPRVKHFLRDAYQSLCDLIPVRAAESAYPITARTGYFFGFHDKCPFSADNARLAAGHFDIPLRMPTREDPLQVGYFDGDNWETFHPIAETRSWNWHQGCQLQWRGARGEIVFNDFINGRSGARIVDVDTGADRAIGQGISTVSPDGRWAAGYTFGRVERCMPGYGYPGADGPGLDHPAPDDDGLYAVDLESGEATRVVTIAQVAAIEPEATMDGATHFVSHAIISPDGARVVFLHRWTRGHVRRRWSRMYTCDRDGGNLFRFPTREMVSHLGWRDPNHVLAWCRLPDGTDSYVLFTDGDDATYERVGAGHFNSDGHPSYRPGGRWIVTDTYPDAFRRNTLIVFDTETGRRYDLARLKAPKRFATIDPYEHWQCDLHPRWDRSGRVVCFDSTFQGERALCTIDLGTTGEPDHTIGT
jgi:hypothetical protein